jgi:hypothetical protein
MDPADKCGVHHPSKNLPTPSAKLSRHSVERTQAARLQSLKSRMCVIMRYGGSQGGITSGMKRLAFVGAVIAVVAGPVAFGIWRNNVTGPRFEVRSGRAP